MLQTLLIAQLNSCPQLSLTQIKTAKNKCSFIHITTKKCSSKLHKILIKDHSSAIMAIKKNWQMEKCKQPALCVKKINTFYRGYTERTNESQNTHLQ